MLDPGNATEVKDWPSANDFLRFCCNITSTIYSKLDQTGDEYLGHELNLCEPNPDSSGYESIETVLVNDQRGQYYSGACFEELFVQLSVIFLMAMIINNVQELLIPFIFGRLAAKREGHSNKVEEVVDGVVKFVLMDKEGQKLPTPSDAESQFILSSYEGTLADYDELVAQFGYVVLFVMAFPLAPLLAMVNNLLEFQVDMHKLLQLYRRPIPLGAMSIGAWYGKFEALSWMCIMSNVALIFFTARVFGTDLGVLLLSFLAIEHVLFAIKLFTAFLIPDTPMDVQEQVERALYITRGLIEN